MPVLSVQGHENTLRYMSLHDNRYLRYFKGHTHQVTTVCLSPKSDLFMSAALVRHFSSHTIVSPSAITLTTANLPVPHAIPFLLEPALSSWSLNDYMHVTSSAGNI